MSELEKKADGAATGEAQSGITDSTPMESGMHSDPSPSVASAHEFDLVESTLRTTDSAVKSLANPESIHETDVTGAILSDDRPANNGTA